MAIEALMPPLPQEVRHAFRLSIKNPGFTIVAVITFGVGIAANTTAFSWLHTVLVRPIPGVTNPAELAAVETIAPNGEFITTSYADYRDYRDHLQLLSGLTVAQPHSFSIGEDDQAQRVWGELVAGNYFAVLGVKPLLGRVFSPDEYGDKVGAYPAAVIGQGLWRRHFNADPAAIGKIIRVNRVPLTVVGVVPSEFHGSIAGLAFDIWVPAMMGPQLKLMPEWTIGDRKTRSYLVLARMKPDTTIEQARSEMAALAQDLAARYPESNRGIRAALLPIWQSHYGAQSVLLEPLGILMAVGVVVLLIVCANVANLLLARSLSRRTEFGIRRALGASNSELARQLLIETLVLAGVGTAIGIPASAWMGRSLAYLAPSSDFPVALNVQINRDVMAFLILSTLAVCAATCLAPVLQAIRADLNDPLKEGGRGGMSGRGAQTMRGALVVSEVALAVVAVIGAGLFARSFQLARQIHPGFDAAEVYVSRLHLSTAGYPLAQRKLFCRQLRQRLEDRPGVSGVVYADSIPLGFIPSPWEDLEIEGYLPSPNENMKIPRNVVAPGYFDLLRIRLLDGRDFTEQDDEQAPPVMIVSENFQRRFFAGRNPIGHKVHGWGQRLRIIGVAKDIKDRSPNEAPRPYFYVPFRQAYREDQSIALFVRMAEEPGSALSLIRQEVRSIDPKIGIFDAMPMTEYIGQSLFPLKVAASLLGGLGVIAMSLAAVGLYSVMAFAVTQRRQEIGIRMALGARPIDVSLLMVRQGMVLAGCGLVAGIALAGIFTHVVSGMLVNLSARDPLVFAAASLFLAGVALVASYIPARRAARVDPNVTLRCQ